MNKLKIPNSELFFLIVKHLKYHLLNTICVRAHLPSLNLLLGCPCRKYVEVEYPVEPKFFREMDVVVILLEKMGL